MDKYILREYQQEAISKALWYFDNYNNHFIIVMPTGAGKSLIISNVAKQLSGDVLILQPTKEILESNYTKLLSYGFTESEIGIYSASCNSKTIGKITYATIGSVYNNPELFNHIKYVILDECHLLNPKNLKGMYNKFFSAIGNPRVMGLTATPYRLVNTYNRINGYNFEVNICLQTINRIYPFFFKKIAYEKPIQELFNEGYLSKVEYINCDEEFDVSQLELNSTGGDFNKEKLESYLNQSKRLSKAYQAILDIKDKVKHILVFASSKRQARAIKQLLLNENLPVSIVFGDTNINVRDNILNNFKKGYIKIVINVGVLTTGFDFPELDCVVIIRPTISLALYYQMIGRGVRISPSKAKCYVLDCCNNVERLGRIETIKLGVEDGFKTIVETEVGKISGVPLRRFIIDKNKDKQ